FDTVPLPLLPCSREFTDASIAATMRKVCSLEQRPTWCDKRQGRQGGAVNMRAIRFAVFFLVASLSLGAQAVSTSQVSGTIQDASGAAIPGAKIRFIQTETAQVRNVTTGPDGAYLVTN